MKHLQIITAQNLELARRSYLEMLARNGIALVPATEVYVETVHQGKSAPDTWLCYIALPRQSAA